MQVAANSKKRNSIIDLTKFVLAVFVVFIHVRPFSGEVQFFIVDCIARLADPLFFVISSYFLFHSLELKRRAVGEKKWDGRILLSYIRRIMILYTIWFVLNYPNFRWQIIYDGPKMVPIRLFQAYFLSGPYDTALWFLPALLWGTILTYFITRVSRPWVALLIGFIFHLPSLMGGVYAAFTSDIVWFQKVVEVLEFVFLWLANGFNYALLYCAIGAYIAVWNERNKKHLCANKMKYRTLYGLGSVLFLVLDINECYMIRRNQWGEGYGALFMMIPFSYFFLQFLLTLEIKERPGYRFLQKMSIVIFGVQFLVIYWLRDLLSECSWYTESEIIPFIFVMAVCGGSAALVVWLAEHTRLRFLGCLY